MNLLSAHDLLNVWEKCQSRHDLDRALIMLAATCPDKTFEELASLPIGERDRDLIALRERSFGHSIACFANCPQCNEQLELSLSTKDILLSQEHYEPRYEFRSGNLFMKFRLPDSYDLAAITGFKDVVDARKLLGKRCVENAVIDGNEINVDDLQEDALKCLSEQMEKIDPQSELMLDLECPECEHKWQILFDIIPFFWSEINFHAKRLLDEVHTLALSYGWSESEILSMSASRRQYYIDRAT